MACGARGRGVDRERRGGECTAGANSNARRSLKLGGSAWKPTPKLASLPRRMVDGLCPSACTRQTPFGSCASPCARMSRRCCLETRGSWMPWRLSNARVMRPRIISGGGVVTGTVLREGGHKGKGPRGRVWRVWRTPWERRALERATGARSRLCAPGLEEGDAIPLVHVGVDDRLGDVRDKARAAAAALVVHELQLGRAPRPPRLTN